MFSILIPFFAPLSAGIGYLALRVLAAIGVGTISYGSVGILLAVLFTEAQGYYNNVPSFALQIIGLAGFGQAFGIIAGAITFRMTFVMMSKLGVIPK